jgi:hypothetical protein
VAGFGNGCVSLITNLFQKHRANECVAENDDSDTIKAIMNIFGTMLFTSFEMLAEHNLFRPDSSIKNITIIPLLWLEFIDQVGEDLDITWACEVVRLCDETGIDLTESLRKQVKLDKSKIEAWREEYRKKKDCEEGDGYKYWAEKKDWKPRDDWKVEVFDWGTWDVRKWCRWDWKVEVGTYLNCFDTKKVLLTLVCSTRSSVRTTVLVGTITILRRCPRRRGNRIHWARRRLMRRLNARCIRNGIWTLMQRILDWFNHNAKVLYSNRMFGHYMASNPTTCLTSAYG